MACFENKIETVKDLNLRLQTLAINKILDRDLHDVQIVYTRLLLTPK